MSWTGGDWLCGACQHQNFKKREACQRCQYPKYGGPDVATYLYNRTEVLAGDWYCTCGAHNYASRMSCYRCGATKIDGGSICGPDGGVPPGWKSGDWVCSRVGCGVHNYACRTECFKCRTPRTCGAAE
ncbi:hypothetical protein K2173_016482 [Erythroxylum novogranatense]|uniref:RanBP2-type domain-containing protein n=1 Tax=Erythroxylum novogranatense TaxID=1862640 RepID=A0AAV8SGI2_9ROSI|nr:hypothetical protein K2173_016482 [Erythroxylum novogranatense]